MKIPVRYLSYLETKKIEKRIFVFFKMGIRFLRQNSSFWGGIRFLGLKTKGCVAAAEEEK